MSRLKLETTRQKIAFILVLAVLVTGVTVGVAASVNYSANQKARRQLEADFISVKLPTYLHLESKKFRGTGLIFPGPGDGRAWAYIYTVSGKNLSAQVAHDDLVKSLKEAGYSIDPPSKNPSNDLVWFYARKDTTNLEINLDYPDKVNGVAILAYE